MKKHVNNYDIQMAQAKKRFLTYDQQELIRRCDLRHDENYFYIRFIAQDYRICRRTGDMERRTDGVWQDGNTFAEVMTVLDWLCDSREDRYITGRWVNIVSRGSAFHRDLQEEGEDPNANLFDRNPEGFRRACLALKGEAFPTADISFAIDLIDGLRVLVQLWYGDEEFAPRLRCLWDENVTRYIRYETTWYAVGLLIRRIREQITDCPDIAVPAGDL